jgi:hypothetical protein
MARPRVLVVVPMLAALAFGASPALAGGRGGVPASATSGQGLPFASIPLLALLGVGVAVIGVGLAWLAAERRRRSGRPAT